MLADAVVGAAAPIRDRVRTVSIWFVVGAAFAALGFVLPCFRISSSYLWWYGGWELIVAPDSVWAGVQLAMALLLLLGGYWLLRRRPETTACALVASSTSAMSVLGLLALAAADGLNEQGRIFRLDWNLGLVLLFPGHGIMITAACAALIIQLSALHRPTQS
jgi:hypothetical protein